MATLSHSRISEFYEAALALVKEGGSVIRLAFNSPVQSSVETKQSDVDLVTETDQAVEKLLIDGLKTRFLDHQFIGEESTASGKKVQLTDAPTWIIDPVDGTTNFVHKFPFCCISLALFIKRKAAIGIIYNPILDELYTAIAGRGAYKNGLPIRCSASTELSKALILSTIGSERTEGTVNTYQTNMEAFIKHGVRGLRSLGSCALNMCAVACGSAEAYVEYGMHCWDLAAAELIVREAGGVVIDPTGSALDIMARRALCTSTEKLAREIIPILTHLDMKRDDA